MKCWSSDSARKLLPPLFRKKGPGCFAEIKWLSGQCWSCSRLSDPMPLSSESTWRYEQNLGAWREFTTMLVILMTGKLMLFCLISSVINAGGFWDFWKKDNIPVAENIRKRRETTQKEGNKKSLSRTSATEERVRTEIVRREILYSDINCRSCRCYRSQNCNRRHHHR